MQNNVKILVASLLVRTRTYDPRVNSMEPETSISSH